MSAMRIGKKIACLIIGTAIGITGVLTWVGYAAARDQYVAGIDRQLIAIAAALPNMLGESYLTRAMSAPGIESAEYDRVVWMLCDYADRAGVYYVYAFTLNGDRVLHLATSASQEERRTHDWAYLLPYEEPPPELLMTFADGQPRFAQYTDEFGSFRSIFVRYEGQEGVPYVVGVDVELSRIASDLGALVGRYLVSGVLVAAAALVVGMALARRVTRPLRAVAQEIETWSASDFDADEASQHLLMTLARRHRDEAGDLASRFVQLQRRLQTYLHELTETTAAKQKIEHQIEIARSIQERLLPREMPVIENFQVVGWSQPADQTGGDFYDIQMLPDGNYMLTIGDVTGHGIGPALLAAASRAYARALFNPSQTLDDTFVRLNDLLHRDLNGDRFVTLVACLLEPQVRQVKLVAAGHGPILFYSRRRDTLDCSMNTHGLPLGIIAQSDYDRPLVLRFEPGDVLVLVSDGFFEWTNTQGEMFGTSRLSASVLNSCRTAPQEIIERLQQDVADFHGGTHQADDTTALAIRCVA